MDNENYILITGWMVNDLQLKGSELYVYALIYGFSQDGQSKFYGSRRYIADWFKCSLPTIDKALNGLLEKGYIIKEVEEINGVIFNRYRTSKETLQGIKNLYRGSKETLHNNTIYNSEKNIIINNNISKDKFKKPTIDDIKSYCMERNNNVDANKFYDFYESKGWMIGKNKMKDWKACVRTWEQKNIKKTTPSWFNQDIASNDDIEDTDFKKFIEDFRNE